MIKTDDIFEIAKRQFFIDKFVPKLEDWKRENKDRGGTQEAFAKMIGVHKNMIGSYKNGDDYPREKTMKKIISVLGVPDDYFTPTTKDELYKYSPEYMTDLGETKILPYCEEIGLDPKFLQVMRDLVGESFGDQFPFWTPISINPKVLLRGLTDYYFRPDPVDFWSGSAEMESDVKMFQIEVKTDKDSDKKKRIILTYSDLLFLRDVQDEVRDYMEFLFLKRKKELQKECEQACGKARDPRPDGGGYNLHPIKAEELNKIDKYCDRYADNKIEIQKKVRRKKDGND